MSQKTNPVSLRLHNSNKHFESCWYSDTFYDQVLSDEIQLRTYIESVVYQTGRSKALLSTQSYYRRYCTFLFFLDQRGERHKREYSLKLSREPIQNAPLPKLKFLPSKKKALLSPNSLKPLSLNHLILHRLKKDLYKEKVLQNVRYNRSLSPHLPTPVPNKQEDVGGYKGVIPSLLAVVGNNQNVNKASLHSQLKKDQTFLSSFRAFLKSTRPSKNDDTAKQEILGITFHKQEYIYNYALKGFSLESFALTGVDSTRHCNGQSFIAYNSAYGETLTMLPHPKVRKAEARPAEASPDLLTSRDLFASKRSEGYNKSEIEGYNRSHQYPTISPSVRSGGVRDNKIARSGEGLKNTPKEENLEHSSSLSNNNNDFYKKGLLSFSIYSLALEKGMAYKQNICIKRLALLSFLRQGLNTVEFKLQSFWYTKKKGQNIALTRGNASQKLTKRRPSEAMFTVQGLPHEHLFRLLIINQYSKTSQNRLSFLFAAGLEQKVRSINTRALSTCLSAKQQGTKALLYPGQDQRSTNLKKSMYYPRPAEAEVDKWHRHTESFINLYSDTFGFHTLHPIRAISPIQNAGFLLESVVYLLQRKSSFRQIKENIFRDLAYSQLIKGMRLSCAGRLGGRSKKAQKAKTQSAQWGETSLTVFSSRLAFASKGVNTPYGKVGVKIWLCYKL